MLWLFVDIFKLLLAHTSFNCLRRCWQMCVTWSQRCLYLAYPVYVNIKMASQTWPEKAVSQQ